MFIQSVNVKQESIFFPDSVVGQWVIFACPLHFKMTVIPKHYNFFVADTLHYTAQLCDLYNNDAIFDKFDCCVAGDRPTFATGSYRLVFSLRSNDVNSLK